MVASAGSRPARVPALTKYEVLEELGHGGMATVYRAHDKRLGRDVAIKVLHPHLRESREIAHRFEAEAKAVAKLRHRNIVEVFDVSAIDEDEQYLVVEFVRGQTLRKLLQKNGALPPEVAAALAVELLGALARQAEDRYADAEQMREALSAELLRVGIAAPRTELESYFDDPEGWTAENEARLIEKLCTLGGEARKRGDAVAAAADYNRALAYAPNDPQLLRIVASMHRAEARMRLVRRAGPLVLGAIALGTGAFFVARALKGGPTLLTLPGGITSGPAIVATGPRASAEPSAKPASTSPTPSERPTVALGVVKPPPAASLDAGVPKKRSVLLSSLQPQYGVVMKIDGVRGPDPGPNVSFMLPDDKAHALSFTCQDRLGNELCVPKTVNIPAGDTEQTLDVQLTILPAKLVVDGEPGRSYGIEEVPNITLASGVAAEIPMRAGRSDQTVTIFDRADPEKRKKQALRAGQQHVVSFKNP